MDVVKDKTPRLVEMSMHFSSVSFDQDKMKWRMTASDTQDDLYNDNMTLELFKSFMDRIDKGQPVPNEFRSEFWQGGLPYVSVSHYSDIGGAGVPGMTEKCWIDGRNFKASGYFNDSPLGKACFDAVWNDFKNPTRKSSTDKVRVSIAFLDYKHLHKNSKHPPD